MKRPAARTILTTSVVLLVVYLILGPVAILVATAFQDTSGGVRVRPPFPWTLDNFVEVIGNSNLYVLGLRTLLFSVGSLLLAFFISLFMAWLVERTDLPSRNTVYALLIAPAGIPVMVLAISWTLLVNPTNGLLNVIVRNVFGLDTTTGPFNAYSYPTMILVQAFAMVPITYLLITASLRGINTSLEEAGATSGAGTLLSLRRITFPLLRPALLGALIYQFVTVVTVLDIPLILGLPMGTRLLSTEIYLETRPVTGLPDYGMSSVYGIFLLLGSLIPLYLYSRIMRRTSDYATVSGKTFRARRFKLGIWRIPAAVACYVYITLSLLLPLGVLVWASIQPVFGGWNAEAWSRITLAGYQRAFSANSPLWGVLKNTAILGVSTAVAVMAVSMVLAWIIVRRGGRFGSRVDLLAQIPHALPGVVIGLATLVLYLVVDIGVYGTIWIIVIAMATQYISLGTRLSTSGVVQIQRNLEEAGETSGARAAQIWRRILLPLLRASVTNGFLLIVLVSIQNLTLPLMLMSRENQVLSTYIYARWEYGDVPGTAVLAVITALVTIVAAGFTRKASNAGALM